MSQISDNVAPEIRINPSKPDIEQALIRGNLINLAHFLPEQPQDFALHLVETFNDVVHLILYDHADPVHPFKHLEDPT